MSKSVGRSFFRRSSRGPRLGLLKAQQIRPRTSSVWLALCFASLVFSAWPLQAQAPLVVFAQISDSQPGDATEQARFEQVLDTIAASGQAGALLPQPVQFVLFAGDLVDNPSQTSEWTSFVNTIDARLTANGIPYRAVPGNHDWNTQVGFVNYESFIADSGVWSTSSALVVGHNGELVDTGWSGLRFIGFNNSNGSNNSISSSDLTAIEQAVAQAGASNENVVLVGHHPHDEGGSIPLSQTLEVSDVVGYMKGHNGSAKAENGLSGIQNPNVWQLNSQGINNRGVILYYEVFVSHIDVYVLELVLNSTSLPAPVTLPLVHNMVATGPPVAPTANFSATPTTGQAPLSVNFTDLTQGLPTSWLWDFGDGTTSTSQSPSHVYAEGTYDVSLTATNDQGSDSLTQTALVTASEPTPTATFQPIADAFVRSASPTSNYGTADYLRVRADSPVYDSYLMFDVNGLGASSVVSATLRLFVDDGSPDGGTVYSVSNGWTETGVNWNNAPGGSALGSLGSVTAGTWVEFDLSAIVTGEGVYSFALASNSTNSAFYSSREGLNPPELVLETGTPLAPTVDFSSDVTIGTAPLSVQFSDASTGAPTSWSWDFGDTGTSTQQSPAHVYTSAGLYTVSLDASNTAGSGNETKVGYIEVQPPVVPTADFDATPTSGPAPLNVAFQDLSQGNPTAWLWTFGDGNTSTVQNPNHVYASPGTYTVSLTVTNAAGSDTITLLDYVNALVPPPITTFLPVADAKVKSTSPSSNYGSEDNLRLRGDSTAWNSYIKFVVSGVGGSVATATLRLFVSDGSPDSGSVFSVSDNSWTELGINYANAPAFGPLLGSAGATSTGQWLEYDVTSFVTGEGTFSFGMSTPSTNSTYFDSREGAFSPELVVESGAPSPDISVSPTSHSYGNVVVGDSASQSFVVSNPGNAPLNVTSTSLSGTNASEFNIDSGGGTFSLLPSATETIVVGFYPTGSGARTASLILTSDDPDEGTVSVPIDGSGVAAEPDIAVSPTAHDYGTVALGDSSNQSFTVANNGTSDLTVSTTSLSGTNAAEFNIESGGGPFTLSPGTSQTVVVGFYPLTAGAKVASLDLTSDDPDEGNLSLSLTGTGALLEPDITVSPSSHDYGAVLLGQGGSQSFTVTNDGTSDLTVSVTSLAGANAAEFNIDGGGGPFTLSPGTSQTVTVGFYPSTAGAKVASLDLTSDDPDEGNVSISLTGSGEAAVPDITVSPSSHDYGSVVLGQSGSQNFTVTNDGTSDLTVSATALTGANAAEFNIDSGGGSFTLIPGASQTVMVGFYPSTAGAKVASLDLTSDDPDEGNVSVSLTGTGSNAPPPGVSLEQIDTGGAASTSAVSTLTTVTSVDGHAYLAAISYKKNTTVTSVTGMGLSWTEIGSQCGGRSATGVSLWVATGIGIQLRRRGHRFAVE